MTEIAARSQDSDSDSDQDEESKKLWDKIDKLFEEFHLSPMAQAAARKWVRLMGNPENKHLERVRDWILLRINSRARAKPMSKWQAGCPDLVPGLRANALWPTNEPGFEWVAELERHYDVIKEELLELRNSKGFQPYRQPTWSTKLAAKDQVGGVSHDSGDWNVFYLFLHDRRFEENCSRCPRTVELLERLAPRQYKHAFFSALNPGTHVIPHTGPTNKKLRCHLPLVGIEGSRLRVADQVVEQEAGRCYVFDDSMEHEAWHDGPETRIVLLFDIWHPDFSDEEVKFLSYLQLSQMRAEREASEGDDRLDNFYTLIDRTRDMLSDNAWWITANGGDSNASSADQPTAACE